MTLHQYNALAESMKADVLWRQGACIANRTLGEYNLLLYQLDSFYVEVWYHCDQNNIHQFRSFGSTDLLDPYLDNIKIPFGSSL